MGVLARQFPGGLLGVAVATVCCVLVLVGVAVTRVYRRRALGRRWEPLRQAVIRDADTIPYTYLAQIHTRPEPATGGLVIATDLSNGGLGPLWLGDHIFSYSSSGVI